MSINEKNAPRQMSFGPFPTVNAGTGATFAVWIPDFAGELVSFNVSDHAGVNPSATSFTTISLVDNTTPTHTMASLANSATTLTQDTMIVGVLSTTATNKRFSQGDAIIVTKVETGGGSTWTNGIVMIGVIAGTYD